MHPDIIQRLDRLIELQEHLLEAMGLLNGSAAKKEEWLDSADIKELLKISERTMCRLRKENAMPQRIIGRKHYYPLSSILSLKRRSDL